jgi:uncharacterized protein
MIQYPAGGCQSHQQADHVSHSALSTLSHPIPKITGSPVPQGTGLFRFHSDRAVSPRISSATADFISFDPSRILKPSSCSTLVAVASRLIQMVVGLNPFVTIFGEIRFAATVTKPPTPRIPKAACINPPCERLNSPYHHPMLDSALPLLRCPIDPARESSLTRDDMALVCQCNVRFPIRQGLPILLATEAEFPTVGDKVKRLPCQHRGK